MTTSWTDPDAGPPDLVWVVSWDLYIGGEQWQGYRRAFTSEQDARAEANFMAPRRGIRNVRLHEGRPTWTTTEIPRPDRLTVSP